jgi:hypothetical protein
MNVGVQKPKIVAEYAAKYHPRILHLAAAILLGAALLVVVAPHAAAQGCAMCYENAASSGAQGRAALRRGILILLVPSLSLFVGIFLLIYRRNASRGFRRSASSHIADSIWDSDGRSTKLRI